METKPALIKKEEVATKFDSYKTAITLLATRVANVQITDDTSLKIATELATDLNKTVKKVDDARAIIKKPYFQAGKTIDEVAKSIVDEANKAVKSAKEKILAFEKQRREAIAAEEALRIANVVEEYGVSAEEAKEIIPPTLPSVVGISTTKRWKFEMVDWDKVPDSWKTLNEAAVKDFLDTNKQDIQEGEIHFGVKFYKEESVTLR